MIKIVLLDGTEHIGDGWIDHQTTIVRIKIKDSIMWIPINRIDYIEELPDKGDDEHESRIDTAS